MRKIAAASLLLWSSLASAGVVSVEFNFTPYTGNVQEDHVDTVAGKARVYINNVLFAEQDVRKDTVPVIFDDREIAPSVWVPMASAGPTLRKGKNSIRIEFEPDNGKAPYNARMSWASVMDETTEQSGSGTTTSTNQSGEGQENKKATGKVTFERDFVADFAVDHAWHHYPAVTALTDADKQQLAALVNARAATFKPAFAEVYAAVAGAEGLDLASIKKSKCVDGAYAVGIRVAAPAFDQLDFVLTGHPEVVVQRKTGMLFDFGGESAFGRIKGDDAQMCAGVVLSMAYPPRMVFVRAPAGTWEVAY